MYRLHEPKLNLAAQPADEQSMRGPWRKCLNWSFIIIPAALPATGCVVQEQSSKPPLSREYDDAAVTCDVFLTVPVEGANDLENLSLSINSNLVAYYSSLWQSDSEIPTIIVRTYNLANAPTEDLVEANYAAGQIFKQAGGGGDKYLKNTVQVRGVGDL